jgi:hypothetical protein
VQRIAVFLNSLVDGSDSHDFQILKMLHETCLNDFLLLFHKLSISPDVPPRVGGGACVFFPFAALNMRKSGFADVWGRSNLH